MKQVEVRIMGQNYLLGCTQGSEQDLLDAVKIVDKEMCDIRDTGKLKARERIAVLAALNIALDAEDKMKQNSVFSPLSASTELTSSQSSQKLDEQYEDLIFRIDNLLSENGQLI